MYRVSPMLFIFALVVLWVALPAHASDGISRAQAASAFEKGNQLFHQGDYQGALDAYQAALSAGYASGALYHNMGSAYFRLDQLGQAILHYEKARRLLPENPTLRHDLEIARASTADRFTALPEPYWITWWRMLRKTVGISTLFWTGLLLYVTAAALLGYRLLTANRAPWLRRTLMATGCLSVLLLVTAFAASIAPTYSRRAVVITEQASLMPAPAQGGVPNVIIHGGALLTIEGEENGWLYVRLPNGETGWVEASSAGVI